MKKPKITRAKLITNGGYTKFVEIKDLVMKMNIPYPVKIQLNSPELYCIEVSVTAMCVFCFEKVVGKTAIYKQTDAFISK